MAKGKKKMTPAIEEHIENKIEKTQTNHISVMSNEVVEYLRPQEGEVFVDGTLGMGGHAEEILKHLGSKGRLIGIDRDAASLAVAKEHLQAYHDQCLFIHEDYRNINKVLEGLSTPSVDGILLDLGLSSFQLDNPERGFSVRAEGPLDMRMDQNSHISAYDLINSLSEREISSILKDFGEERWHKAIARRIVWQRAKEPIETTKDLSRAVLQAIPMQRKRKSERIHPATRTFQAFRIAVNRELESLEIALETCKSFLKVGGRLGVIAFHSLEDRIVKHKFRAWAKEKNFRLSMQKPLRPTEEEIKQNSRARSARLRVIERI